MGVNISTKPILWEPEGFNGFKIYYRPISNTAFTEWTRNRRAHMRETGMNKIEIDVMVGPKEVFMLEEAIVKLEGFSVDDRPGTVKEFIEIFPIPSVVYGLFERILNFARLSKEEEKNSDTPSDSGQLPTEETTQPSALSVPAMLDTPEIAVEKVVEATS